jgi:purine nucleosidase
MKDSKTLVDTDAGVDDILALFVLRQNVPGSMVDVAVTFGNVPLKQAMSNVALFLSVSQLAVRNVLRGSSSPRLGNASFATNVHGGDGLGGITKLPQWKPPTPQPIHDLFTNAELDAYRNVVALGPLTDIARLTIASSSSPPLFVMGGAFNVRGNITPFAEFNFYSDPNAASSLFKNYHGEVFLIPLDVCNTIILQRAYLNYLCDRNENSTTTFLKLIHQHYMDFYLKTEGIDGCHPHDALAICASIEPGLFEWGRGQVRVLEDGPERGRSIFEPSLSGRHRVARAVDSFQFLGMLERAITSFTPNS